MNEETLKLRDELFKLGVVFCQMVGSTYIIGQGRDIDLLCYVHDRLDMNLRLEAQGFKAEGSDEYPEEDNWTSLRRGVFNVIVTDDIDFYSRWIQAAEVCKYLGLADKRVRIAVHQIVVDGCTAEGI